MDPQDQYRKSLEQVAAVVRQIRGDQLANETPDDEWTVRDLANHILYQVSWVPAMVQGETIDEIGDEYDGELYDGDVPNAHVNLIAAFDSAAAKADLAVADADPEETAHMSYGDAPVTDYLMQAGGDILVHGWDLAKAIGVPFTFDPAIAQTIWDGVKDQDMSGSGLFKKALPIAESASYQDKILAHFGRDPQWQRSKLASNT